MTDLPGRTWDRYMQRMPGARDAYERDALYHHSYGFIRGMLELADMAMEDNDIPEEVRSRVLSAITYGGPNEADAMLRIQRVELPEWLPPRPLTVDDLR